MNFIKDMPFFCAIPLRLCGVEKLFSRKKKRVVKTDGFPRLGRRNLSLKLLNSISVTFSCWFGPWRNSLVMNSSGSASAWSVPKNLGIVIFRRFCPKSTAGGRGREFSGRNCRKTWWFSNFVTTYPRFVDGWQQHRRETLINEEYLMMVAVNLQLDECWRWF